MKVNKVPNYNPNIRRIESDIKININTLRSGKYKITKRGA